MGCRAMNQPTGAHVLDQVGAFIRQFVVLTESEYAVISLWVLHTYCLTTAETTPYLNLGSAEKRCGKTRTLEVLELLVCNPWYTGRVTAAALIRKIANDHPTLLLDESDAAFRGPEEYSEALRATLNSGHRRGGKATICVGRGAEIKTADFDVFSPKAIAGIGKLPDTVADRSIPIRLKRKSLMEKVNRFRRRLVEPHAKQIREQLAAWAEENTTLLVCPPLPEKLTDRQQDGAEPLLAIADCAGGDWPQRARAALVEIFTGTAAEDDSVGVQLLSDIRTVFEAKDADRLSSEELVLALGEIEGSPWPEYQHGQKLSPTKMARLLKPFDLGPRSIRIGVGTPKGYLRESFEDAWSRYCPCSAGCPTADLTPKPQRPPQVRIHAGITQSLEPQRGEVVAGPQRQESSLNPQSVAAVAVAEPTRTEPPARCYVHGIKTQWWNREGEWMCRRCHPDPRGGNAVLC